MKLILIGLLTAFSINTSAAELDEALPAPKPLGATTGLLLQVDSNGRATVYKADLVAPVRSDDVAGQLIDQITNADELSSFLINETEKQTVSFEELDQESSTEGWYYYYYQPAWVNTYFGYRNTNYYYNYAYTPTYWNSYNGYNYVWYYWY